ncbi:hypothetical protein ACIQZO_04445 [Streptomyces sp. NPDC097617]|uniref:hypothetical protein n=1 Tax=Streptomyces sp. NPDC097617 TaxID=3366091 RepID=UPI0037FCBE2D
MRDLRYAASFHFRWRPLMGRLFRAVERQDAEALAELIREMDGVAERDSRLSRWGRDVMGRTRVLALLECAKVLHDPAVLDRAVDLARGTLMEPSTTWEAEALDRSVLGEALVQRFEQRGDQQDVDDAITAYRQAWDLCRAADAAPRMSRRRRLRRLWRESWSTEGAGPWPRMNKGAKASILMSLGDVLHTRFTYLRILDDFHGAVRVSEEAEAYTRTWGWAVSSGQASYGHGRGIALSQYGRMLAERWEYFGAAEDIVRAVWFFKDADRLLPRRDDEGPTLALHRVHALTRQGLALNRVEDFTEAASVLRRRAPRDPHWLPQVEILTGRAGVEGSTDGLEEAVDILEAAAARGGSGTHRVLIWLASTLRQWAVHIRDNPSASGPADAERDAAPLWRRSTDAWRLAAHREAAPAFSRLHAASYWSAQSGQLNPGSAEAAEASSLAVRLLPLAAWRGLDRLSQEGRLKAAGSGLATSAAADQLAQGDPAQALELLELGRGVLWSQKLDGRTDLKLLAATSPELAESLTRVRVLLEGARDPSAHTARKRLMPPP